MDSSTHTWPSEQWSGTLTTPPEKGCQKHAHQTNFFFKEEENKKSQKERVSFYNGEQLDFLPNNLESD
jgi:hypothetical protein